MTGEQAFTFAIMVLVLPLFALVFGTAVLLASPVLILLWIARRLHWNR